MRSIAPTFLVFFCRKCASQESCRVPWVHFPCVFSHIRVLRSGAIGNLHAMRPTAPWFLIFVQGKRASQQGFLGVVTATASFHSYPSQEESQILIKEHCTGDVGLIDSQFLTNRGSLWWEREASKRMSHQKVGMSKVAYHRMLVGGLDVVKRAKRWNAPKNDSRSSEHHKSSTRRLFMYVVGGRVGMNDTCYFTLDMKKLDPPTHPPNKQQTTNNKQTNKQTNKRTNEQTNKQTN